MARLSIQKVHVGQKDVNCYVITCAETGESVVLDPGDDAPKILQQLERLKVRWICVTHGHSGHVGAKEAVKSATGASTAMHLADATAYVKSADHYLSDGEQLPFGKFSLEVIATPGHSAGGLSYKVGNHLFTGDTLLPGGVGRVDIPGASPQQLFLSLHGRLLILPDNTVVYPGHGPNTTIGAERLSNPALRVR